jgi:hypothetical protein
MLAELLLLLLAQEQAGQLRLRQAGLPGARRNEAVPSYPRHLRISTG